LLKTVCLCAFSSVGTTISYGYAVFETLEARITVGQMAMFLSTISQMESSLGYVTFLVSELYRHALYVNELFEFLDMGSENTAQMLEPKRALPRPIIRGIEFRNVSFKYPQTENEILSGINFTIKPGETVALVGENGAGKTTIVKLLARLYHPTQGQILIDGIDLNELDVDEWRSALSVVFQDYCRFHLSLRANVGIGLLSEMNRNGSVEIAAERGGAASVAAKFSNGYETMLGKMFEDPNKNGDDNLDEKNDERIGIELSGGEWQRIALSRAFMRSRDDKTDASGGELSVKDAELLILDEPTAALDVQSEYDVYCRFHELTAGKMALLITHRFSTVRIADTILVLEGGKIVESGSHEELMSRDNSSYAKLYNLQADRYK
jgi:ATP-binding cassette subfamily B protein